MTTLEALVTKLETIEKETERVKFDFKDVKFGREDGKMVLTSDKWDTPLKMDHDAFSSLLDTLDVPKKYALRCPPDLQEHTVNYWLSKRPEFTHSALVNKDAVRTFMNNEYAYVPTARVLSAVADEMPDDFIVGNYSLNSSVLEAQLFSPQYDQHVIDSNVRGGMKIVFSDSWSVSPKFDTYLYRVLCTNGMVSPLDGHKFRISGKSEAELIEQVKGYVVDSLKQIPEMYAGFLRAEQEQISNVRDYIRRICQENKLPKKVADILIETLESPEFLATIRGNIRTMHDLVNLLTYVGTHNDKLPANHREHLMAIAGSIILHNTTRCNSCHAVVAA